MVGAVGLSGCRRTVIPGASGWNGFSTGRRRVLHGFVARMVEPGAHVITDGLTGYGSMPDKPTSPRLFPAKRHTGSFTGCIAYSQTSNLNPQPSNLKRGRRALSGKSVQWADL